MVPAAWNGENELDVAVFDEAVLATLDAQQQSEVAAVKESLQLIECGKSDQASEALVSISRKSEMSDWRLLIRGIASWLASDLAAAQKAWGRLDTDRRPARIASALQLAHREDLTGLAADKALSPKPADADAMPPDTSITVPVFDRQLLTAAKIVRRIRIDRPAIKIATAGLNQKLPYGVEIPDATIVPEQIQWLKSFCSDFRDSEPDLVRALEIAALDRALNQPYTDVFSEAVKTFRGPAHDPKNLFRIFQYWVGAEDNEDIEDAHSYLYEYVNNDLPSNEKLSKPLRNAMTSVIWLQEATYQLDEHFEAMRFGFAFPQDVHDVPTRKTISDNFKKSTKAYPAHEMAHEAYFKILKLNADDDALTKKQREQAAKELMAAMKRWVKAIPNSPKPRTYLAERFLEAEQFEDAAPHIQWIVNSRPKDPRLKILPWKSKLFEAMNLCRRKSTLSQVPDVLAEVESLWPSWLSSQWLPYFNTAWQLRSGEQAEFQKQRETIYDSGTVKRDSVVDACMMLGAAQCMRVPAADLRPLREPVDLAVKSIKKLSTNELLDVCSFFWAMNQVKVFYPAFRMHGSKFSRELLKRLKGNSELLKKHIDEPRFQHSVYWFSEHRFWGTRYESKMPPSFKKLITKNVCMAAAHLNGQIQIQYGVRQGQLLETVEFLNEALRRESNPFYRFWFAELIAAAEEKYRKFEATNGDVDFGGIFGQMLDQFADNENECDCEKCRAARESAEARERRAQEKSQAAESKKQQDSRQANLF